MNEKLKSLDVGLPQDIMQYFVQGDYSKALDLIEYRLKDENLPEELRNSLVAHQEIIRRIPVNYPYNKEEAVALVRQHVLDFTEESKLPRRHCYQSPNKARRLWSCPETRSRSG